LQEEGFILADVCKVVSLSWKRRYSRAVHMKLTGSIVKEKRPGEKDTHNFPPPVT
jgi:hypothetical protein